LLLALEKVGVKSADELKGKSVEELVDNLGLDVKTATKINEKVN